MGSDTLELSLLFDFFGDLLTSKQRECFDLAHNEDLSLSEIAENLGISRQGVHDNISRAEAILRETESKTGIVKRFSQLQVDIEKAQALADQILCLSDNDALRSLSCELIDILQNLKG